MKQIRKNFSIVTALFIALAFCISFPMQAAAQQNQYEYEADEGIHQEEWYDPGDWFDTDDAVDYETDWYDYTYNYPYDYDYDYDYYDYGRGYYGDDEFTEYGEGDFNDYGYNEAYEENYDTFYEDDEFGWNYDYYSDDWYDDEGAFEEWYD